VTIGPRSPFRVVDKRPSRATVTERRRNIEPQHASYPWKRQPKPAADIHIAPCSIHDSSAGPRRIDERSETDAQQTHTSPLLRFDSGVQHLSSELLAHEAAIVDQRMGAQESRSRNTGISTKPEERREVIASPRGCSACEEDPSGPVSRRHGGGGSIGA
jgi:hypothetical protein